MNIDELDVWDQLREFDHKRDLLATLVRVARDLNGHTHALHDVQLLAKPSQQFPKRVQHYKSELKPAFRAMDETQLTIRSKRYDKETGTLMEEMLKFIELTQAQLEQKMELTEFTNEARAKLEEFESITHMAVSVRLLLQDRGVFLPAVRFDFPQEWIGEQIEALNDTNHTVRIKPIDRVADLIFVAEKILGNKAVPEKTRDALRYVQHAMKENLEYLEHGGNIEALPFEFEELELNTLPADTVNNFIEKQNPQTITAVREEPHLDKQKMSFNKKLKMWLDTPWSVKWRDLD